MSSGADTLIGPVRKIVSSARAVEVGYVILSAIGLIGLCAGQVPFSVDLANHAARLFIECHPNDPVLSQMYEVRFDLIPNLAIDLINRPLCGFVDPITVVRGTMIAAVAGILLVTWNLHVILNDRPNAFVLLAPSMTFNIVTGMGYVNYLIGILLFLTFAWTMLRYRILERSALWALLIPNIFGVPLYLCHVFALGLAGVFLFGLRFNQFDDETIARRGIKAGLLSAASFVIPLAMLFFTPHSGAGIFYSLPGKVRTFWATMLYSSVDVTALLVFIWFALFLWVFREKYVALNRSLRWPLLFVAIFSMLLPSALFDAVDLDSRSLVAVSYLAIAMIGPRPPNGRIPYPAEFAATIVAVATLGLQLSVVLPKVSLYDRQVAEFRAAAQVLGPYDRVLSLMNFDARPPLPQQLYSHLVSWETRDRGVFNPLEFTGKGMQPLLVKPVLSCIDVPAGRPIPIGIAQQLLDPATKRLLQRSENANLRYAYGWPRNFNYVVYYHFGAHQALFPGLLVPVRRGSFFTIFRSVRSTSYSKVCVH